MATILHIEDDPVNRRLVTKLLSAAGHTVVDAATGLEGIRIAAELVPDLILVDINIPDLDGYEVTLRLRGIPSLATTPIVAITAEGDRETSLAVGCDGFFGKPIDARVFARRIERFIGGKRERGDQASGEARLREKSQQIVARLEAKVRELSEANARLEEMARLRREFLRNVTHELATPMTPVVGYLRLLHNQDLGPLSAAQHKCVEAMTTSTDRLRAVVDLLLDVSTFESGNMHARLRLPRRRARGGQRGARARRFAQRGARAGAGRHGARRARGRRQDPARHGPRPGQRREVLAAARSGVRGGAPGPGGGQRWPRAARLCLPGGR